MDDSDGIPLTISSTESNVYYVSLHAVFSKGLKIKTTTLSQKTGKQIGEITLNTESEIISRESIIFAGSWFSLLIWKDKASTALKINIVGSKHITSIKVQSQEKELAERILVQAPRVLESLPHFLIQYQSKSFHWAEVYHANINAGTVEKAYDLPVVRGQGVFSASVEGANVYFIQVTDFEVTLVSSLTSKLLGRWHIPSHSREAPAKSQHFLHTASEVISKGASNYAVRCALAISSGDWQLVRDGDILWTRPEGLTGTIAAAFFEPLREEELAQELAVEGSSNIFAAYSHRLKRHLRDLKHFPVWMASLPGQIKHNILGDRLSKGLSLANPDGFGFHKLIIVATERGWLMGLDAKNEGKIVWNTEAVSLRSSEKWSHVSIDIETGVAWVKGQEGEIWQVQARDGKILEHKPGAIKPNLKKIVNILSPSGENVVVPVNKDGSLDAFPKNGIGGNFSVVTWGAQGSLKGWMINENQDPHINWEFMLEPGEVISSFATRQSYDPVASIGRALGDRNVLYKYLNPNILLIATLHVSKSKAVIYVLDSVSGQALHSVSYSDVDVSKPVTCVMSENWIAYSLFLNTAKFQDHALASASRPQTGYQLVVSEFFESGYNNNRGPRGSSSNFSSIYPIESITGQPIETPFVLSQAYSIPGPITSMSVTSTLQGITPHSLICFLPTLQSIISIPRSVLDPRRPVGRDPLPIELEEGLFRHNSLLEFEPKWILSHLREVTGISTIITSPTRLESTSIIFAFGDLDIFGTRVMPIGGFDMLGKGFGKLQLVGTVLALGIGTGVVAPLVCTLQVCFPSSLYIQLTYPAGPQKAN